MTEQELDRLTVSRPGIDPVRGELSEEDIVANLRYVDTETITDEDAAELVDDVRRFFENLSERSFFMRFGRPKPAEPSGYDAIVRNFLYNDTHPPKVVTLTYGDHELIGACSIFAHQLRSELGSDEIVDSEHVVELSLTIADDYQRQGLGTILLEAASRLAADEGRAYVYCSFEPGNEASRKLVRSVLGSANLVAGATNPTDKYYRLPTDSNEALDYDPTTLEAHMRAICGDAPIEETATSDEILRTSRLQRYGRRALRALRFLAGPIDRD